MRKKDEEHVRSAEDGKVPHPDPQVRSKMKVTEAFDTQIVHGVVRKNPFRGLERWRAGSVNRWRAGEDKHSTSVPQKEGKDPRERNPYPSHLRHNLKVRHFVSGMIHFDVKLFLALPT